MNFYFYNFTMETTLHFDTHCDNFWFFRNDFMFCVSAPDIPNLPSVKVFKLEEGVFDPSHHPEMFMEITAATLGLPELKPEQVFASISLTDALLIKSNVGIHVCDITNLVYE